MTLPKSSLDKVRASLVRCKGAASHLKNMNEAAADAFQRAADAALEAVKPQLVNKYLGRVAELAPELAS